jgi:hypothetical protein
MSKLIGLIGKRRSGKDTVAIYLHDNHEYEHKKFAQPMKDAIEILFNFKKDQLESSLKDEIDPIWNIEPRKIMQLMGTEFLQYELNKIIPNLGNNFAVKRLFMNNTNNKIVISDVRFIHEVKAIKERGGILIKIVRESIFDKDIDNHISEQGVDDLEYDYLIINDGSIKDLYDKIEIIMQKK